METSRGDAAAATWTFRGDESRRHRSCDVAILATGTRRYFFISTFIDEHVAFHAERLLKK